MAGPLKPHVTSRKTGGKVIESRDLLDEYREKDLSRRSLLLGALSAAAAAVACSDNGTTPTPTPGTDAATDVGTDAATDTAPVDTTPPRTAHLVGAGQHDDHVMAAELALQETHNFDFVQRGQTASSAP